MDQEFTREPGDTAISNRGFTVSVTGGMEVTVAYTERDTRVSISAERLTTGGIGLFMDWAPFPEGTSDDDRRRIFEGVVRALRYLGIPVDVTDVYPDQHNWPLPRRPNT